MPCPKTAAKLRKFIHLQPVTGNITRCPPASRILKGFLRIHQFILELNLDELDAMMPSTRCTKRIEALVGELEQLDAIAKTFQRDNLTVTEERDLIEEVLENYQHLVDRLKKTAPIVHDADFETLISKILSNHVSSITIEEKLATSCLRIDGEIQFCNSDDKHLSFAEKAMKRRKIESKDSTK